MDPKKSKPDRLLDMIHLAMAWAAAACILFMMLAICYSVILRYFWNKPVPWIVEVSSYLMLYITFLGTAWLLRQDGHVEVDLFLSGLKPRVRALLRGVTSLGGLAVGFILTWKGAAVTLDFYQRGVTMMGILSTPQCVLLAIIPVGGFFLFIEFLLRIWRSSLIVMGVDDSGD
jgi:TRAP-type C4-dicarboxylate transport system permease small subunit